MPQLSKGRCTSQSAGLNQLIKKLKIGYYKQQEVREDMLEEISVVDALELPSKPEPDID